MDNRFTIAYDTEIMSWAVYDHGRRVGFSQTEAGVKLIRRNLRRRA